MTNTATKQPLKVSTEGTAGPYIRVPQDQLDELERLLKDHGIFYWVRENAISLDGGPYMCVVNLGREGNASAVQALLDGVR
jgi:hypothetical protein